MPSITKSIQTESKFVVARNGGEGKWRITLKGHEVSFYGIEMFYNQLWEWLHNSVNILVYHWVVHFI